MNARASINKVLFGFEKKRNNKRRKASIISPHLGTKKCHQSFAARVAVPADSTSLNLEPHAMVPLPIDWFHAAMMVFMTVTLIAPIRLLASFTIMIITSTIAFVANHSLKKPNQHPTARERILQALILVGIRLQLFFMGVHYIHIDRKGKRVSKLLVSNHITAMDSFILAWVEHTRCVICDEFFSKPFVGTILRALQFLDASETVCKLGGDPDNGRDIIKEALNSGHPDPILVFPQGTTARQDVITEFQDYSFSIPNQYITPVVLKFYDRLCPFLPWLHHNHWMHCFFLCCNFDNSLTVVFGEPVRPLGAVKSFKEKVQGQMAMLLNGSVTRHGYPDSVLLKEVVEKKHQINNLDQVIVKDWLDNFHLSNEDISNALNDFKHIDRDKSGSIDYLEFCKHFKVDENKLKTLQLFRCLDDSQSLTIEFHEFLTAFAISRKSNSSMARYLFKVCDTNGEGRIGLENFKQVFCNPEDTKVREFAEEFFSKLENSADKLEERQWMEKIKILGLEGFVGQGIQKYIFQQNHRGDGIDLQTEH